MSLREEIVAEIISLAGNDWLGWEDNLIEKANFITRNYQNKVLNAAVEAAQERQIGIVEAQDSKRDKLSMIVVGNSMIEAIKKLRGD
jgi:hypothetical protein